MTAPHCTTASYNRQLLTNKFPSCFSSLHLFDSIAMSTETSSVVLDEYYYEPRADDVNLESITSTEDNALILEKLRNNDRSLYTLGIVGGDNEDEPEDFDFDVQEGDDVGWLGYFIGQSIWLESLSICYLPVDKSFSHCLALNQSIQKLYIWKDIGKAGFQTLAPFFQNTDTLEELLIYISVISLECAQNVALLLSQCQIKSLTRIIIDETDISDEGLEEIARALRAQPQLEELNLTLTPTIMAGAPFDQRGYVALGNTMKNWTSPRLKKLVINAYDLDDDGLLALVEGMANCVNLEHLHLDLGGSRSITAVGLKALSSLLFQSKKFCLQSLYVSDAGIGREGMITLA